MKLYLVYRKQTKGYLWVAMFRELPSPEELELRYGTSYRVEEIETDL